MTGPIEAKVAVPAVVSGAVATLATALFRVAQEFGVTDFTGGQTSALTGLGAAALLALNVAVGYLAPHTERYDLPEPSR